MLGRAERAEQSTEAEAEAKPACQACQSCRMPSGQDLALPAQGPSRGALSCLPGGWGQGHWVCGKPSRRRGLRRGPDLLPEPDSGPHFLRRTHTAPQAPLLRLTPEQHRVARDAEEMREP